MPTPLSSPPAPPGFSVHKRVITYVLGLQMPVAGKWLLLSAMVGVVAGLGAIVFQLLLQFVQFSFLASWVGFPAHEAVADYSPFGKVEGTFFPWRLLLLLAGGGFAAGWLTWRFAPEAAGHGTDAAIDAFHNKRGEISLRVPIVKTLASALTLGTGGSAGREGPIAQIGAGFGSYLATRLRLSARDRRILLAAGMGAGVGAIFRAPLAGALFAGEILYRDAELEADVIMPAAVASTIAYSIFCFSLPNQYRFMPLFGDDVQFDFGTPLELIPYGLLAIVLVLAGILYIRTFYWTRDVFEWLPGPSYVKAPAGALLAGLVGLGLFTAGGQNSDLLSVLGSGYGMLQSAFSDLDGIATSTLLAVGLVKIITTSLTISSGGSGGVFGPSMVIGGCLGGAVGKLMHSAWPQVVTEPAAFAVVGMAGFFAGCAGPVFNHPDGNGNDG